MDTSLTPLQPQPQQQNNSTTIEKPVKIKAPSPIIVENVQNLNKLHSMVKQIPNSQIKVINDNNVKINVPEGPEYRMLSGAFTEQEYTWYSYEDKQDRPIKSRTFREKQQKNNVVIFGIKPTLKELSVENICNYLNSVLGLQRKRSDIIHFYQLEKLERSPIKVEFVSTFTKIDVLRNTKKLKGINITISPDLTKSQQKRNKILRNHLLEIRQTTQDHCYIKGEKLYRNNTAYSVEDIQIEDSYNSIVIQQSNSAPQTPARENHLSTFNQDNNKEIRKLNDIEDKGAKTEKKEEKVAEHKEERKEDKQRSQQIPQQNKEKKRKEKRLLLLEVPVRKLVIKICKNCYQN
ncbi:unnamed protein product [Psylliodes chrysocephalus]|uniref:Uncharacterized protein n=1 Tax=Psylliodes chrysocephalus TaxID=3402493 RepID=A0A9P0DCI5_9CUCU|nr:unnamed protein product [Psylliodes chrysocephala]